MDSKVITNRRNRDKILRSTKERHRALPSVPARLRYREINGFCSKTLSSGGSKKRFLPKRFAFPIKSLIDDHYLHEEGHVFLGFSSCNNFLISYTEALAESRHSGFLSHVYTLYWWLWEPQRKAKQVGRVGLFGNEEIEYSLFLCYAEWPTSKSHIVLYGFRTYGDSAYITIATVPSLSPCKECDLTPYVTEHGIDEAPTSKPLCIKHGYTVHFKQASGTSNTGVLNRSSFKIDDVLVLNIGHSIAVLSTGSLFDDTDLENLPLSQIKRSACEEPMVDMDGDILVPEESCNPAADMNVTYKSELDTSGGVSLKKSCKSNADESYSVKEDCSNPSVYDIDDSENCERINLSRQGPKRKADKENMYSNHCEIFETQISLEVDPYYDPEPKSIVLNWSNTRNGSTVSNNCNHGSLSQSTSIEGGCSCQTSSKTKSLTWFAHPSVLNERQISGMNSRSELSFMTPSPTASDGSSSLPFSDSGIPIYNGKANGPPNSDGLVSFSETFYGPVNSSEVDEDHPLPAGDTSVQFCAMSCTGGFGETLHPLDKGHSRIQAYSQNLVLDLEHVIFDILRTRCYTAYKYGYLVDYEANILDVCTATRSVVVHIAAILNIRHSKTKLLLSVAQERPLCQQAEFILSWSLSTGRYEVVVARPFVPYDERKSGQWKGSWILGEDSVIKRNCSVPIDPLRSVYILDNLAVLNGQSLSVLWSCDRTLAITK